MQRTVAIALAIACSVSVLALTTPAQEDARLKALIDEMRAFVDDPTPMFLREQITVAVGGQVEQEITQEAWMLDLEHVRTERADGTVMLYTPEGIKVFVAPFRAMLHVPQETLEALGDDRWEQLEKVDLVQPRAIFDLLVEEHEHLTITGEDEIAGEECWVVTADAELLPRLGALLGGIPDELEAKMAQISLGKESAAPLGVYFEFTGPAQLEVGVIVEEAEEDVEMPDDLFTFEPPQNATTLTWTPDRTADEMHEEFYRLTGRG